MLSNQTKYIVKNQSGNVVAMVMTDSSILVYDPEQAVEACLNDIVNLYSTNPDTTGMLLLVERVNVDGSITPI